ncbi:MAG TPA: flagellar motor protein MotB [Terriglobia bacterium]|nr:flagellar motor protein MotB [Terriglobia bacterium]
MARKKKHEEHVNHERWLVSYADFITLLFAFFVTLYAISQVDAQKLGKLVQSMQSAFDSRVFEAGSPRLPLSDGGPKGVAQQLLIEPISPPVSSPPSLLALQADIQAKLERAHFVDRVRMVQERRGLVVSLTEAGFFDSGQADLKASGQEALRVIAQTLQDVPYNLRIEGHTDNTPIHTARFPSNWELSTARATFILSYLTTQFGFRSSRLSVAGYGEHRPIGPNNTDVGRAMNRRVDIVILSESEQLKEPETPEPRSPGNSGPDLN